MARFVTNRCHTPIQIDLCIGQVADKRQDSIGAAPRDQVWAVDGDKAEQVG